MPQIPDIPGNLVARYSDQDRWLKAEVSRMCGVDPDRFPGSQPVSFGARDLDKLEAKDFWVCEKSDGIRVLFLVSTVVQTKEQNVYLIDRHNTYRQLNGLVFPHHANPSELLRNTLVDGELVIDIDPRTQQRTLRLLAFDCLIVDNENVMSKPLEKRYGRLKDWFHRPYAKMIRDFPAMAATQPFDIKVKNVNLSYHVDKVFAEDIPALQHENDGLIYTCSSTPYTPGTDTNIIKWKPPSENSIDFKLVLRFPPSTVHASLPDFEAKPLFALHVYCGDESGVPKYEPYDQMHVDDEEWEKLKLTGEQIDDRIVEVHWDVANSHWRMMRFRDDKPNGNYKTVVENIIQSIAEGVEKDVLLSRSNAIRDAWKVRHGQPVGPPPPPTNTIAHPPPTNNPVSSRPPPPPPPPPPARQTADLRYGPLGPSRWSKVAGPTMVSGMYR